MYTVVGSDGLRYGPADIYQLKSWAVRRRIRPDTLLIAENDEQFPAEALEPLAAVFYVLSEAPSLLQSPLLGRDAADEAAAPPVAFPAHAEGKRNPLGVAALVILFELFAVAVAWLVTQIWR
jgi:hypothetical protein